MRSSAPTPPRGASASDRQHAYGGQSIIAWEVGGARRSDGGEAGGGYPRQDAEGGTHGPPREAEGVLDRTHELDVEGVAPVARDDVREDRAAEEREIADEIEDLVPDELVAVAQAVERPALREHDRVVERAAAREPVLPHDSQVLEKPVGARRGDVLDEGALRDRKSTRLNSSHGYISYAVFCLKKKKKKNKEQIVIVRGISTRRHAR